MLHFITDLNRAERLRRPPLTQWRTIMRPVIKSAVIGLIGMVLASPAMAQVNDTPAMDSAPAMTAMPGAATIGAITNGNTTIEFQNAASNPDLNQQALIKWGEFADAHPRVAQSLAYKPALMSDAGYLRKHPELADFFASNPQIRDAMAENPGNFVAIPPRPGE
jgi:hypothetical protein